MKCFGFLIDGLILNNFNTTLKSLHSHPLVKRMFLRFNTTISSTTPVERLFSLAGLTLAPVGQFMSDKIFETLVLLKANKNNEK